MEMTRLSAEARPKTGTSEAKRLRRQGKIPAILYGDGGAEPIVLDQKEFRHAIHGGASIFNLSIDGHKAHTAMVREIQRDPTRDAITHVDLMKVGMKDKLHTTVTVHLTGDAPGVKMGGVLQHALWELEVQAVASDLPSAIDVDVSELELGHAIHVSDVTAPEGVEILTAPDSIVVTVLTPSIHREEVVEVEEVAEEEAAEAAAAGAEEKPAAEEGEA